MDDVGPGAVFEFRERPLALRRIAAFPSGSSFDCAFEDSYAGAPLERAVVAPQESHPMQTRALTLVGLLAAVLPAQVGKPMPSLEVEQIYNFSAMQLKRIDQLRGSVVFLEYWQTW